MFGFHKKKKFEPLVIENECGKFTMEYYYNDPDQPSYCFDGDTILPLQAPDDGKYITTRKYIGARIECDSNIDCGKIDECIERGFARLKEVVENFSYWEDKVKKEALENEWSKWDTSDSDRRNGIVNINNEETITQEEFFKSIFVQSITVSDEGSVQIWLGSNGLLGDGFGIVADENDNVIEYLG